MKFVAIRKSRRHFVLGLLASYALARAILPLPVAFRGANAAEDGSGERLLRLINQLRVGEGLVPLRPDSKLAAAAQSHAEDMAAADFFDHTGPSGTDIDARLARAGYAYRVVAENIAAGSPAPERTVQDWMRSGPHRKNILLPEARDAGVGYVHHSPDGGDVQYRHYWTLVVAAPR